MSFVSFHSASKNRVFGKTTASTESGY